MLLGWRKPFDKACHDILVDMMRTRGWRVLWEKQLEACQCDLEDDGPNCEPLDIVATDLGESRE